MCSAQELAMPRANQVRATLLLAAFLVTFAYAQTSQDDIELQLGIQAFKQARYEEAIQHFEKATASNPQNSKAHLYLATAYAQQYIPGADIPENVQNGRHAIAQYKTVLQLEPSNVNAVKGIAYLCLQMKEFEEAKTYYGRASEIDPNDPEPYYSAAVIDWTMTYEPRMKVRARLRLPPEKALIGYGECNEVRTLNEQNVADGIDKLTKAIQLRPDYDDAMAYMNLMYRERADIQCGDSRAYSADIRKADKWVDLTMATKKAKAEARPAEKVSGEFTSQPQQ
jgi:tetratricopeptide (TPR) repeat protein